MYFHRRSGILGSFSRLSFYKEEETLSPKGGGFQDSFDDLLKEAASMSDADLERAMAGASAARRKTTSMESLEPGTRVRGVVVEVRAGEVLLELDGKTLGVLEESEFPGEELPAVGSEVEAQFEHYDRVKDLAVLSIRGVRREVFWDDLRGGTVLEGTVVATNKGGLTIDVKGVRAFLPISQIELTRVEDLSPYVGRKLRCEVTSFDRGNQNIILSRRPILEREAEASRERVLATLTEGQVLRGTVVRITDHGAFVDIGGIDGLLPAKGRGQMKKGGGEYPPEGQGLQVRVVRVDRERGRVLLEKAALEAETWGRATQDYKVGEEVTGWVSRRTPDGLSLSIEEGVEGLIPQDYLLSLAEAPRPGAILKAVITAIDAGSRRITLRPIPPTPIPETKRKSP